MMKTDFDQNINRFNTDSYKWDIKENELPMWVADMDFKTAPEIIDDLKTRVEHGVFGYTSINENWSQSIQNWWIKRHQFKFEKEWMIFSTGVVAAVTTAVQRLTNVGDNVVIQTPTFNVFYNSILNHGRRVLENPLKYDGLSYSIDFEDLEKKLALETTSLIILSNPQNPSGNIWSKDDLKRIGDLSVKYNVVVLSDEIHCDLCDPGYEYIPYASVSENCLNNSVTCVAASKTFNLAGLQSAAVIIANPKLKVVMERGLNSNEVAEPNAFAAYSTVSAFTKGEAWLEELRVYLHENKRVIYSFIKEHCASLKVVESHATYLVWIDISELGVDAEEFTEFIRVETGLIISAGNHYGGNGSSFIRMNAATSRDRINDGLNRLKKAVDLYKNRKEV